MRALEYLHGAARVGRQHRPESGDHATELTKSPGFSPGAASPPDPPAAVTAKLCFAMGAGTHRA